MTLEPEITTWLAQLADQPTEAAQVLWQQYYARLVQLARKRLRSGPRRVADEEDVALSAFHSFCRGVKDGRFPQLADRQDLWKLLVVIAARKAGRQMAEERRQKRGGGRVRGDSVAAGSHGPQGVEGQTPEHLTPDFACQVAEEFERLLGQLTEPGWQEVALLKLEGYSSEEIGDRLGCSLRTVERRLAAIRQVWSQEKLG
jgi:DNA-directed RNA polymerase specialized sigma24 family protein